MKSAKIVLIKDTMKEKDKGKEDILSEEEGSKRRRY